MAKMLQVTDKCHSQLHDIKDETGLPMKYIMARVVDTHYQSIMDEFTDGVQEQENESQATKPTFDTEGGEGILL